MPSFDRAAKRPPLTEHDLELLFQRLVAEKRVEGLAASDQVLVCVRASIRLRKEVFDARVGLRKRALAEEAVTTLFEK
jgi:hypothetical protein